MIAVVMRNDPSAPIPTLIDRDTFMESEPELWGDGTPPKPPEPEPIVDPFVALEARVRVLEEKFAKKR